ncbi:MAG TPA: cation:proton antiporter [Bryobacteraceae bacterium]|nr:cation:proton antiporter [Bryobacteraceae bacterium]
MINPGAGNPAEVPLAVLTIFASAKLLREVFERLKQPGIIGEIVAGAIIGPHVLGWIHPNEVLSVLSELGVMFLLFLIGLEVKPSDLLRVGGVSVAVATCGAIVPFALVGGIALAWGMPLREAVFVGAAMVATSVAITAEVLASRGLLSARASRVILAAAVVDDVIGLIALALVSSYARGEVNWTDLIVTTVLASGFTVFVAVWGHRAVRRIVPKMEARMRVSEAQFTLSMALLFGLSLLAVYAGVAAIIGAFLAGMALSETVDERVHAMTSGVSELLVPFFLAGIGMQFDPAVFASGSALLLSAILLVAAVFSKLAGCGLAAFRLGRKDAVRIGVGMAPRGEVGMVVAQLGRKMGVMSDSVYAIIVFLSIATTLVAPPMIKAAFRGVRPELTDSDEVLTPLG